MKVLKPLLWFLVPTVVIWAAYFIIVAFLYEPSNTPRFADERYYYELFMQDEVFLTALKNTLKITILPAFVVSIAAYLITAILKEPPTHTGPVAFSIQPYIYICICTCLRTVSVKYNIDLRKKAADEIMASVEYRTVYGSRGKYTRESETV